MISFLGDSALPSVGESFALRGDLLLPIAAKVGKSARRNLRFLHFRACYGVYGFATLYHAFAERGWFRFV